MRNKKLLHLLMVGVISLGIILAGAFAWTSFTQTALNIFEGWTNPDVNLIDDHIDSDANKDVYVENSGKRPLFVRVRFDEYMEIDGKSIMSDQNAQKGALDTWTTHECFGTNGAELCNEAIHSYYNWVMGNMAADDDKGRKYYLSAPFENRALFDELGTQLTNPTEVTFNADEAFYGFSDSQGGYDYVTREEAFARIDATLAAELTITPEFTTPTYTSASNVPVIAPFTVTAGTTTNMDYLKWLYSVIDLDDSKITNADRRAEAQADKVSAQAALSKFLEDAGLGYYQTVYDVASKESVTGNQGDVYTDMEFDGFAGDAAAANQTLHEYLISENYLINDTTEFVPLLRTKQTTTVYTMGQWVEKGMPVGPFWVMDTDGWCYWADVLPPGQTTGLLLSEVNLSETNPPEGVWYYGINVSMQAVTADDIIKFNDVTLNNTYTDLGAMLLDAVSGKYVYGVDPTDTTGDALNADAVPLTYEKFKDNTYRQRISDGSSETYGPLFIYTGATGSNVTAMRDLYNAFHPTGGVAVGNPGYFTDNTQYKVGAKFWKLAEVSPETWVEFTVVNAGQGTYPSGVIEAANGKRYVKLSYVDKDNVGGKEAWLAVGANGIFEGLVPNTGNALIPAGTHSAGNTGNPQVTAASLVSNNDDQLIWIPDTATEPGGDNDRYSEALPVNSVNVGDTIEVDSIEWIVLGMDVGGTNDGKTLIISKDVLEQVASTNIATALAAYNNGGGKPLTNLTGTNGNPTAILLTATEVIDYFSSNSARAAEGGQWWLADSAGNRTTAGASIVDVSGGFTAAPGDTTEVGLRVALWVDSTALYNLVYPAP